MCVGLLPPMLHAAFAWGAMLRLEIARKSSVLLAALMFLLPVAGRSFDSPYFPFFAYVALFMLPLAQWKPDATPGPASLSPERAVDMRR